MVHPSIVRSRLSAAAAVSLMLWWGVALAAVASAPPDLLAIPWAQAFAGVVVTAGAGMSATLGRQLAARYADKPFLWRSEVAKDLVVSAVIGIGGYALGWRLAAHPAEVILGLIAAGYAGTRALSAAVDRLLDTIRRPAERD